MDHQVREHVHIRKTAITAIHSSRACWKGTAWLKCAGSPDKSGSQGAVGPTGAQGYTGPQGT